MDSSKPYQEKLIVSLHIVTAKKGIAIYNITTNYEMIRIPLMAIGTLVLSMKSDITILQVSRVSKISCNRAQSYSAKLLTYNKIKHSITK